MSDFCAMKRRTYLRSVGSTALAGSMFSGATAAQRTSQPTESQSTSDQSCDAELAIFVTDRVNDIHSTNNIRDVIGWTFPDALDHVGVNWCGTNSPDAHFPVPKGVTTVDELYTEFSDWLASTSPSWASKYVNLLVAREDDYEGEFYGEYNTYTESDGGVAVTLGAEAIDQDLDGSSTNRYGSSQGDYWLNRAMLAAGYPLGVVDGHGMVYQDSNVGSGNIATPAAPMDDDVNVCGSSSTTTDTADIYDHYYWDGCAGSVLRNNL